MDAAEDARDDCARAFLNQSFCRRFGVALSFTGFILTDVLVSAVNGLPFSDLSLVVLIVAIVHCVWVYLVMLDLIKIPDSLAHFLAVVSPAVLLVAAPLCSPSDTLAVGLLVVAAFFAVVFHCKAAHHDLKVASFSVSALAAVLGTLAFGSGSVGVNSFDTQSTAFFVSYVVLIVFFLVLVLAVLVANRNTTTPNEVVLVLALFVFFCVVTWVGTFHRLASLMLMQTVLAVFYAVWLLVVLAHGCFSRSRKMSLSSVLNIFTVWFYDAAAVFVYVGTWYSDSVGFVVVSACFAVLYAASLYVSQRGYRDDALALSANGLLSTAAWTFQIAPVVVGSRSTLSLCFASAFAVGCVALAAGQNYLSVAPLWGACFSLGIVLVVFVGSTPVVMWVLFLLGVVVGFAALFAQSSKFIRWISLIGSPTALANFVFVVGVFAQRRPKGYGVVVPWLLVVFHGAFTVWFMVRFLAFAEDQDQSQQPRRQLATNLAFPLLLALVGALAAAGSV